MSGTRQSRQPPLRSPRTSGLPYIGFFNENVLPKMAGKPILPIQPLKPHVLPNINPEHYETMQRNGKIISLLRRGLISPEQFPRQLQENEAEENTFITANDTLENYQIPDESQERPLSPQNQSYGSIVPQFSGLLKNKSSEPDQLLRAGSGAGECSPVGSTSSKFMAAPPTQPQHQVSKLQVRQQESEPPETCEDVPPYQQSPGPVGEWVEYTGQELANVALTIGITEGEVGAPKEPSLMTQMQIVQLPLSPGAMNQSLAPLPSRQKGEYYAGVLNDILRQLETIPPPIGFAVKEYMPVMMRQRQRFDMQKWPQERLSQTKQQLLILGDLMSDELNYCKKQLSVLAEMESVLVHVSEEVNVDEVRKGVKIYVRVGLIAEGFIENNTQNQKPTMARIKAIKGRLIQARNVTTFKNQILRINDAVRLIEAIEVEIRTGRAKDLNQAEDEIENVVKRLHLKAVAFGAEY